MSDLPKGWTEVALGEVCEVNPKPRSVPGIDEEVAFLGMASVHADGTTDPGELRRFGDVSKGYTQFERGDVLVAKITPCFENGKIAQADPRTRFAAGSTEFHVVRPRDDVEARYVLHYLRQPRVRLVGERRMTGSGGQRRVPTGFVASLRIPLPPLEEQRRIAAILDKADELRAKRRAALEQLDSLTQAIFLDMFGDPARNPLGWPEVPLVELADDPDGIKCGPFGTQLARREYVRSGVPLWGIPHVNRHFQTETFEFLTPEKAWSLRAFSIRPGDIVMTRKGTVGNSAVYPGHLPEGIMHSDLLRLRMGNDIDSVFLTTQMAASRSVSHQIRAMSSGAVMAGLNVSKLKELIVLVPPLGLQHRLRASAASVAESRDRLRLHLNSVDLLFASLQARAFRGEL